MASTLAAPAVHNRGGSNATSHTAETINTFWNENFKKEVKVAVADFMPVFVKRFNGKDGYRQYPAHVLYNVVYHFLACTTLGTLNDLKAVEYITVHDLAKFAQRFGALDSAVDTIAENFLDPKGDAHMWYLMNVTQEIVERKMKHAGMSAFAVTDVPKVADDKNKCSVCADKVASDKVGDFHILLYRMGKGLRTIHIERLKNSATGKVTYGTKSSDDASSSDGGKVVTPIKGGIIAYLKEHTDDRIPIQSQTWLTIHHDEFKAAALQIFNDRLNASEPSGHGSLKPTRDLASEERKHFHLVWEGYSPTDQDMTTVQWTEWHKKRGELLERVAHNYNNWSTVSSESTSTSPSASLVSSPSTGSTSSNSSTERDGKDGAGIRYVKSHEIHGLP